VTAWIILATCGPAAIVAIWWANRIGREWTTAAAALDAWAAFRPPVTDDYVDQQIALLEQQWEQA
jgi:hypothetical protein